MKLWNLNNTDYFFFFWVPRPSGPSKGRVAGSWVSRPPWVTQHFGVIRAIQVYIQFLKVMGWEGTPLAGLQPGYPCYGVENEGPVIIDGPITIMPPKPAPRAPFLGSLHQRRA